MHAYITLNIVGMHLKFLRTSNTFDVHNTQLDDDHKIASPWCLLNSTAAQGSHIGKSLLGKYLGNNCQKNDDRTFLHQLMLKFIST